VGRPPLWPLRPRQAFSATRAQLEAHLTLTMGGQTLRFAGEHIGAMIVRELRRAAEAHVGREIHKAVLAVPVGFNRQQINATREAAELAGLEARAAPGPKMPPPATAPS
jgi:molecular chaperone DnaK